MNTQPPVLKAALNGTGATHVQQIAPGDTRFWVAFRPRLQGIVEASVIAVTDNTSVTIDPWVAYGYPIPSDAIPLEPAEALSSPVIFTNITLAQQAVIDSMRQTNMQLVCWPPALTIEELDDLEARGIVYHVHHGPSTYGATTYHLKG